MRCWKTREGTLIIECEPLAGQVSYGPIYREVDLAGTVLRSYTPYGYSDQECSGEYRYAIERDVLVERWTEDRDRGAARVAARALRVGLSSANEAAYPFLQAICHTAVELDRARTEEQWAQARQRQALRLRSASELPGLEGDEPLDLVLTERDDEAVVLLGERVLWREPRMDWPRHRGDDIRHIFQEKYGPRLRSFKDWLYAE
jgi:hypothetical protein